MLRQDAINHLAIALSVLMTTPVITTAADTGSSNPLLTPSTLPFQAPPFDKIKDADYQPAIEAGMAEQMKEIDAIANNPAPPTFDNTFVAMEKSGQLLDRADAAFFDAVAGANTNPALQKVQQIEAPKLAAHRGRASASTRSSSRASRPSTTSAMRSHLDPESRRLVECTYEQFVHAGANLAEADKDQLKKINEELSILSTAFMQQAAGGHQSRRFRHDRQGRAGRPDRCGDSVRRRRAAKARKQTGYVLPLQNTTQQPALQSLSNRATRQTLFETVLEARRARRRQRHPRYDRASSPSCARRRPSCSAFPTSPPGSIEDQMAKTPEAALQFSWTRWSLPATASAAAEAKDIQALIDAQNGGFKLAAMGLELLRRAGAQGQVRPRRSSRSSPTSS